jgi:hypothetical protein
MVLRLWSRLLYNEESIACEPCRVGLRPALLLFQHPTSLGPGLRQGCYGTGINLRLNSDQNDCPT